MMELFTLGAGNGYTERDVREQARRALTGWTAEFTRTGSAGCASIFKRENHDDAMKVIFDKAGPLHLKEARCDSASSTRAIPPYFVDKLWSYFIPVPPDKATSTLLQQLYVHSGYEIRPVVTAILRHPAFSTPAPRMTKSPVCLHGGAPAHAPATGSRPRTGSTSNAMGGAAALLPAERERLERRPLARHLDFPGAPG